MDEQQESFLDTPEGHAVNSMAFLAEVFDPEIAKDQDLLGVDGAEMERFLKERSVDELCSTVTRANRAIVDRRIAPLLRLVAKQQRDLALGELDRRFPT